MRQLTMLNIGWLAGLATGIPIGLAIGLSANGRRRIRHREARLRYQVRELQARQAVQGSPGRARGDIRLCPPPGAVSEAPGGFQPAKGWVDVDKWVRAMQLGSTTRELEDTLRRPPSVIPLPPRRPR